MNDEGGRLDGGVVEDAEPEVEHHDQRVTLKQDLRAQLLERLKGDLFENVERTVDVHVRNLRVKLEVDSANPQYILTVFGVGYRFMGESD